MRVALVNLWSGSDMPDGHITEDHLRRELSRRLAALGHDVLVVQEHPVAAERRDGAVRWRFVPPSRAARAARRALAPRADAGVRAPATHVLRPTAAWRPDVVHSFDLPSLPTLALLGALCRATGAALVVHDHGGAPLRRAGGPLLERAALSGVHRLLFTTRARAAAWVETGALPDLGRVVEVFETSTPFTPGPAPRLEGAPAVLHAGRLDAVKDPLTTVEGFRRARAALPGAVLHLCHTDAPLDAAVRRAAAGLPVRWHGRVDRAGMEALHRGADLFVQASVREVCGVAPLEALATGTPPVLSDIPPFRRLTDDGRLGRLFPVGDPGGLAAALVGAEAARAAGALDRATVRAWFDRALSFDALAGAVDAVYRSCRQEMSSTGAGNAARQSPDSQASSSA